MKITNDVLHEKIVGVHTKLDLITKNHETRLIHLETETKENTQYRQKATGVIAVVMIVGASVGSFSVWILNKLWGNN